MNANFFSCRLFPSPPRCRGVDGCDDCDDFDDTGFLLTRERKDDDLLPYPPSTEDPPSSLLLSMDPGDSVVGISLSLNSQELYGFSNVGKSSSSLISNLDFVPSDWWIVSDVFLAVV